MEGSYATLQSLLKNLEAKMDYYFADLTTACRGTGSECSVWPNEHVIIPNDKGEQNKPGPGGPTPDLAALKMETPPPHTAMNELRESQPLFMRERLLKVTEYLNAGTLTSRHICPVSCDTSPSPDKLLAPTYSGSLESHNISEVYYEGNCSILYHSPLATPISPKTVGSKEHEANTTRYAISRCRSITERSDAKLADAEDLYINFQPSLKSPLVHETSMFEGPGHSPLTCRVRGAADFLLQSWKFLTPSNSRAGNREILLRVLPCNSIITRIPVYKNPGILITYPDGFPFAPTQVLEVFQFGLATPLFVRGTG